MEIRYWVVWVYLEIPSFHDSVFVYVYERECANVLVNQIHVASSLCLCVLVRSVLLFAFDMENIWLCECAFADLWVLSVADWNYNFSIVLIWFFLIWCILFTVCWCWFMYCSLRHTIRLFFFVYEKDHICFLLRIIKTLNYSNTKQRRLTQGLSSKYFTIVIVVEVVIVFVCSLMNSSLFFFSQLFCSLLLCSFCSTFRKIWLYK